jgi:hypothetical protein
MAAPPAGPAPDVILRELQATERIQTRCIRTPRIRTTRAHPRISP